MRIPAAVAALVILLGVSACTSNSNGTGSSGGSAGGAGIGAGGLKHTADCTRIAAAARRLTSAQADLYGGNRGSQTALSRIVTELHSVQNGAPSEIKSALADLAVAFRQAEQLLQHPTQRAGVELSQVAHRLADDGKKVTAYVDSKCR